MIRKYYDKILLGIALALLLAVFGMAAFRPAPQSITEFVNIPALRPENIHEVSAMPEPDLDVPLWDEPPPQSAGQEWVFDVFTPPVIYFNPQTETFTVLSDSPQATPWEIELVAIREELYRVQLIGYLGKAGDYRISLENRETGKLLLAREGNEYEDFEIAVRSFEVKRTKVPHTGGTEVYENVATVVIYDQRLDREITLRSDVRRTNDESTAHFRAVDAPDQEFRAGVGDTFTYQDFAYTVDALDPPAKATVTRTGGEEEEPETKTLIAKSPEGGPSSQDSSEQPEKDAPGADEAAPEPEEADADF